MKNIMMALAFLTISSNAFCALTVNSECLEAAQNNRQLQKDLVSIKAEVDAYSSDRSLGYSEKTGQIFMIAACAPFVTAPAKIPFNLCHELKSNVAIYEVNQAEGFSMETAKILNEMGNGSCF